MKTYTYILFITVITLLSSCYNHNRRTENVQVMYSEKQKDSLEFIANHHYTNGYNFVVKADSLVLLRQQPEEFINNMRTDSVTIHKHNHIVVAQIHVVPTDSVDSVWVQVARDQSTIGWIRESRLTPNVMPDDPISQFISTFSDIHTLIFLIIICVMGVIYLLYKNQKRRAPLVHFRDINSFYPTLLALIVALAATFYSSIQLFAPDKWQYFYYHPTLNPFSVSPLIAIFLVSIWLLIIVGIAVIDDIRRILPFGNAMMYLSGLAAVCAINYIVFSVTTLFYVGYLLLPGYIYFAFHSYFHNNKVNFICGICGEKVKNKGRCPHCGAINE